MKDNEVQRLIDIRAYLIHRYNSLDGRGNVSSSVMLQRDVAGILERTIEDLDKILVDYVEIKK